MIDTHCHLDDFEEVEKVIRTANENGVKKIITCGSGWKSTVKNIELANKYDGVFVAAGLGYDYPENEGELEEWTKTVEEGVKSKGSKVVAIGECGLDYWEHVQTETWEKQIKLFKFQIETAKRLGLPLMVHCRRAFDQVYGLVKDINLVGQMHCFTGSEEWMKKFCDLGWCIGIGGMVTFKKSEQLRAVVKYIPDDKLVIETDAPWLSPEPVRESQNEPKNAMIIAKLVAELRGQSLEEVDEITTANAQRLFKG